MKQYEQVIKVMEENGGWTTLGFLYHKVNTSLWKTKTPFATIRRIVQDERFFFKIKVGLWALKSHKKTAFRKIRIEHLQGERTRFFPFLFSRIACRDWKYQRI